MKESGCRTVRLGAVFSKLWAPGRGASGAKEPKGFDAPAIPNIQ